MPQATDAHLSLGAETAAGLMRPNPPVIRHRVTFTDALAIFIDRNLTVAPVIDDEGVPIGVLSVTDLLIHVRESAAGERGTPDLLGLPPVTAEALMTPTVFAVGPETPAAEVVSDMLRSKVHHLFVTDARGTITGVIAASDVLAHLK
ncbi:MAG TPA: CBS domain-containing protein [Gemmataceae bacterium]|nr:CBS domain-containing protein [Gemmataceae bacterium]